MQSPNARVEARATSHSSSSERRWAALLTATNAATFCRAWLDIVASRLHGLRLATVLLRGGGPEFRPAATWPADAAASVLAEVVEAALSTRQLAESPVPDAPGDAGLRLALPVETDQGVSAVVAAQFGPADNETAWPICESCTGRAPGCGCSATTARSPPPRRPRPPRPMRRRSC